MKKIPRFIPLSLSLLLVLVGSSCATHEPMTLHADHPAHPDADVAEAQIEIGAYQHPTDHSMHGKTVLPAPVKQPHMHHARPADEAVPADSISTTLKQMRDWRDKAAHAVHKEDVAGVQAAGSELEQKMETLARLEVPGRPHFWHMQSELTNEVRAAVSALANAQHLEHGHHMIEAVDRALEKLDGALKAQPAAGHKNHGGH